MTSHSPTRSPASWKTATMALVLCVGASLSSIACSPGFAPYEPTSEGDSNGNPEQRVQPNASKDPKANSFALTDTGEKLIHASTIEEAHAKFNEAKTLDPENKRAVFWAGASKLFLQFKGILTRVRPLYQQEGIAPNRYAIFARKMTNGMSPSDLQFIKAGPEDIRTGEDLQEWMDRVILAISDFKRDLRAMRDSEFTINAPPALNLSKTNCTPIIYGPIRAMPIGGSCDSAGTTQIGMNRADFEAILNMLSTYQVIFELWTAYRIDPVLALEIKQMKFRNAAEGKAAFERLIKQGSNGKLRKSKPFEGIMETTADAVTALKYVMENQDELCANGQASRSNRQGYLLDIGLCFNFRESDESSTLHTLRMLEGILVGEPLEIKTSVGDQPLELEFDIKAFVNAPIADLAVFEPLRFDDCGNPLGIDITPFKKYITLRAGFVPDRTSLTSSCPLSNGGGQ